jgi:hypothetical protein
MLHVQLLVLLVHLSLVSLLQASPVTQHDAASRLPLLLQLVMLH